jgi:hypothetical protein
MISFNFWEQPYFLHSRSFDEKFFIFYNETVKSKNLKENLFAIVFFEKT